MRENVKITMIGRNKPQTPEIDSQHLGVNDIPLIFLLKNASQKLLQTVSFQIHVFSRNEMEEREEGVGRGSRRNRGMKNDRRKEPYLRRTRETHLTLFGSLLSLSKIRPLQFV